LFSKPLTKNLEKYTDPQLKPLQRGCFRYFQRGGQCIDGPVGLLAGIIRQPFVLFYHFFAVALLAIWIYVVEGETVVSDEAAIPHHNHHQSVGLGTGLLHPAADESEKPTPPTTTTTSAVEEAIVTTAAATAKPSPSSRHLDIRGMPGRALRSVGIFWKACAVIFPYILSEMRG